METDTLRAVRDGLLLELRQHPEYNLLLSANHYSDMAMLGGSGRDHSLVVRAGGAGAGGYGPLHVYLSEDRALVEMPPGSRDFMTSFELCDPSFPAVLFDYLVRALCPRKAILTRE